MADVIINGAVALGISEGCKMDENGEIVRFSNGVSITNPIQYLWAGLRPAPPIKGSIQVFFDGGSRNNPKGPTGYGFIILNSDNGDVLIRGYGYYASGSSNEMEYRGLLEALVWAQRLECEHVTVMGDSQLVLQQVKGSMAVRDSNLQVFHGKARGIVDAMEERGTTVALTPIPRAENTTADMLCNMGIDSHTHSIICDWGKMAALREA